VPQALSCLRKRVFIFLLAFFAVSGFGQVTIQNLSYSDINSAVRQYRVYYPSTASISDKLPIVVYIHGGGWWKGGLEDESITPGACNNTLTVACWLAENGYVVYSIEYTLVTTTIDATDLVISSSNTVTSASHTFVSADIGSALLVLQSNTGDWNIGGYTVQSVANGAATLNASPGSTIGAHNGEYSLIAGSTLRPVQWQDCNCFLRYMAETVGVTTPGDLNNVYLMGHSAGGHLVGMLGLGGNDAFPTNCDHSSTNYTVQGIMAASPPTDLATLYVETATAQSDIRDLLGCIPGYQSCDQWAAKASIINYVAPNLPPYISFSGNLDIGVNPENVEEASQAFAALSPSVVSTWILLTPDFYHDLDLFYFDPCSSDPDGGGEPSPCGSAGMAFQDMLSFLKPASITVNAGNNQSVTEGATAGTALAVNVTDQYGQAVSGASVTFTASAGTGGASGTFNGAGSVQVITNSNGLATAPPLLANLSSGSFTVTAGTAGYSTSFSLNVVESTTPSSLTITSGNNQSMAEGGTAPTALAVSVTNQYGQALTGVSVTFTANSGSGGESGTFNGVSNTQAVSNSSGIATAPVLAVNSSPGTFTVTASGGGLSTTFSMTVTAPVTPSGLTIKAGNYQTMGAGTAAPTALAVLVTSQSGAVLSGVTVTFTANSGSGGACGTFNSSATAQVVTNTSGIATAPTLTTNSSAGSFTVTSATAGLTATFTLTNTTSPTPASLTITSGNYQSIPAGLSSSTPLSVSVLNQYGSVMQEAEVIFTVNAGAAGESGTFSGGGTAYSFTNSIGVATAAALTVNAVPGPFSVTASAGSVSTTFYLNVGSLPPAFGSVDTPVNNSTGIAGAISVNGWALSPIGIQSAAIWRDPVPGESSSLVYVGSTAIIPGSRPDVAAAHPGYPCNNCGWGAQVLTNELPDSSGQPGIGNGSYTLHILVTDNSGQTTDIGATTFAVGNAGSAVPFGTIDTPTDGQTVSGTIVNFGWALTPQPNTIPTNGSTIWVFIDNVRVGHPVYNQYRLDIATIFPGLQNSNGAVGYYYLDTTTLSNGLHTIAWTVTDNAGNAQGIGSRYFNVQN
jgi:acetyl esterase/lipase